MKHSHSKSTSTNPYPGRSARGPAGKKNSPFGKASALSHALAGKVQAKGKKIGDAVRAGHSNYKNRTDDTNKNRSILYWKDNKN